MADSLEPQLPPPTYYADYHIPGSEEYVDITNDINHLKSENAKLWKALIHAKHQRDRSIYQVNKLRAKLGWATGWHPDNEGEYDMECEPCDD